MVYLSAPFSLIFSAITLSILEKGVLKFVKLEKIMSSPLSNSILKKSPTLALISTSPALTPITV